MCAWAPTSAAAAAWIGAMTGPGSSETRSHSSSGGQPGVKPVVAVSGRTTSSAPVASTQRVSQSTHFPMLALTTLALRGPATGAIWTAAAVKARMSSSPGSNADGHAGESDRGADERAVEEVPALEGRAATHRRSGIRDLRSWRSSRNERGFGQLTGGKEAGDVGVDRREELTRHLLGHPREHPLTDATDHATHDGIGIVGQVGATRRRVQQADLDVRADRPGRAGAGSPENEEARGILFGEGDVALIGALDRRHPRC